MSTTADIYTDYPYNQIFQSNANKSMFMRLYDMKIYYLNEYNTTALIVGLKPSRQNLMELIFNLQCFDMGHSIILNRLMLNELLIDIRKIFNVNINYPHANITTTSNKSIFISQINTTTYRIETPSNYLIVKEACLMELLNKEIIIYEIANNLNYNKQKCEEYFEKILDICKHKVSNTKYSSKDVMYELINIPSDIVPKHFIYDTIMNNIDFFLNNLKFSLTQF